MAINLWRRFMKLNIVWFTIASVFLASCSSALPEAGLETNFTSSLPVKSINILHHDDINVRTFINLKDTHNDTFQQVYRIGDSTFNLIDFKDKYPFKKTSKDIILEKFDLRDYFSKKTYYFNIDDLIDTNNDFKYERYHVPQHNYPLAFFEVEAQAINDIRSLDTYYLHFLLTDTNQTELWLTESTMKFAHQIDTIDHFKSYPAPIAYYNNYIDYYNGWIVYAKGNDIHLINLFAELSLVEDDDKKNHITYILASMNNSYSYDVGQYHQNQANRIIPGALNEVFKPEAVTDMKRLLHLHEFDNHIFLTFPTQDGNDIGYVFDKQFAQPPEVFKMEKNHYRIYRGKDTENDHSMIMMFDNYDDEIAFYDIVSKEKHALDLRDVLSPLDRNINHLVLSKQLHHFDLIIFPDAFNDLQNHYFLILELDEKMVPITKLKLNLKTDLAQYHYQTLYRTHENDFFLLASDKYFENYYLFHFSLESKTTEIEAKCYSIGMFDSTLKMLYHPGGYFMLQSTVERDNYDHRVYVKFYNLQMLEAFSNEQTNEVSNG
jgi:hypothetical protein